MLQFNGNAFRAWWAKLEQYFEAEGIAANTRVRTVMLPLEGKTLDWHHFYTKRHGGFHMLTWDSYAQRLRKRFGSSVLQDPITDLVSLRQVGSVDQYHDTLVSLLNQLHLPETYALSIFIHNMKAKIGQYLQLFKPKSLVDDIWIARYVENILNNTSKHGLLSGW